MRAGEGIELASSNEVRKTTILTTVVTTRRSLKCRQVPTISLKLGLNKRHGLLLLCAPRHSPCLASSDPCAKVASEGSIRK